MGDGVNEKIYTTQFWLLCVSSLLFFASFNMLIPELPSFLTSLGGAKYKGLIVSIFTLTAMLSRPFSGKLADRIGRVPVIVFGVAVCFFCSLLYPFIGTIAGFLWLRFAHGFSTGFTPTGQSTYLADIIPLHRRGEAMGMLGTAGAVGMAGGPAAGGFISDAFGLNVTFYCSSVLALVSVLILMNIKETLKERQPFSFAMLAIKKSDVFEPRVIAPCVVMVLSGYAYGVVLTLLPDFGAYVNIHHKGILFAFLTIASLTVRLLAGKASDRFGRVPVLKVAMAVIIVSMLIIATASGSVMLAAGVILYGFAQGATSPTLLAWATDLSSDHHKGRGIASVYIFMELGIGVGAFTSGMLYDNKPENFFITFAMSSAMAMIALAYLIAKPYQQKI